MAVTIKDIAEEAGVSLSTVSRVLNSSGYVSRETRERVERVIARHNYVPSAMAAHLAKGSGNVVGVLLPEIDNPFFSGILKGINEVADASGLNVLLCDSNEKPDKERRLLRTLLEQRVCGLLVTTALSGAAVQANPYRELDIPVVLIDRELPGAGLDSVFFDDERAIFELVSLLLENGHRHIEMLAGNPDMSVGQNRERGYRKAYECAGHAFDEAWIHFSLFTQEAGYRAMGDIADRPATLRPTAVVAGNNMLTLGALRAIFERRLAIPDDFAFAGYDQIEALEILRLGITLAEKDTVEMGRVAMKLLGERILQARGGAAPQKIILSPTLVARGSERLAAESVPAT